MGANLGPKIVRTGLVIELDAADINSYIRTGTNWVDMARGDNGTLTNGPTFNSANGGSIVFDGTNDYVVDSSIVSFNVGCIDMWIKPTSIVNAASTSAVPIQLRYGVPTNSAWYIALGSLEALITNEYITIVNPATNSRTFVADGGSLAANTWVNIVINWESTIYKIYINNIVKTTISGGAGDVGQLTNPNVYYIGALDGDAGVPRSFFNGSVGITRLYNRTLTSTELLQNYNAVKSRFGL